MEYNKAYTEKSGFPTSTVAYYCSCIDKCYNMYSHITVSGSIRPNGIYLSLDNMYTPGYHENQTNSRNVCIHGMQVKRISVSNTRTTRYVYT